MSRHKAVFSPLSPVMLTLALLQLAILAPVLAHDKSTPDHPVPDKSTPSHPVYDKSTPDPPVYATPTPPNKSTPDRPVYDKSTPPPPDKSTPPVYDKSTPDPPNKSTPNPPVYDKSTPNPPNKSTPNPPVYDKSTPDPPNKSTPNPPVYDKSTPNPPNKSTPNPPVYDKSTPDKPVYDKSTPDQPNKSTPNPPVYDKSTPDKPVYDKSTPDPPNKSTPPVYDKSTPAPPDKSTPDQQVYDKSTPDKPVYDKSTPDKPVGDKSTPGGQPCKLDSWISRIRKEYHQRRTEVGIKTLDPKLSTAEGTLRLIKVRKDGRGDCTTITDAIKSIPSGNKRRVIVWIAGGVYNEKITIDKSKPFVTFFGEKGNMPNITYDGTATGSSTVAVEADYFMAVNVAFVNSAPIPDGKTQSGGAQSQVGALKISGDKAAFHGCHFISFLNTICDDIGNHLFKDCHIQGTVDFIFGNGKSLYLKSTIESVAKGVGVITAQAAGESNEEDDSGLTFAYCKIIGSAATSLGKAWKDKALVFAYTYMGTLIQPEEGSDSMQDKSTQTTYYGEYQCMGPGAISGSRAKYAKMLTGEEAKALLSMTYMHGNKWLLPPPTLAFLFKHFALSKIH